jgi:FkbM family methyltransferase
MSTPNEQAIIRDLLRPLRSPCIVELGAHTGDDSDWLDAACSEATHHILVEPDPRNCQIILDRSAQNPINRTRRLIIGAVSDKPGIQAFHFSDNARTGDHGSGSLRQPTGHLEMKHITFNFSGMVQCYTLDQIFEREWLSKIDLLWVDVQGAEDLMIRGGQMALKHTRYLFVEVETVELYAGQALERDLYAMLPGWDVAMRSEQNALLVNRGFKARGAR